MLCRQVQTLQTGSSFFPMEFQVRQRRCLPIKCTCPEGPAEVGLTNRPGRPPTRVLLWKGGEAGESEGRIPSNEG